MYAILFKKLKNKPLMKNALLLIIFVSSCFIANAQLILNGDFEKNNGVCQLNIKNLVFDSSMYNCTGFGSASQIDIINSSCGYGAAKSGSWFLGVAIDDSGRNDAFSMTLASPLIVGHIYELSFYARSFAPYATNPVAIGVSKDSVSFGTKLYISSMPIDTWTKYSFSFTDSDTYKYITLEVVGTSYSWTHVDNFKLTDSTAGINPITGNKLLKVYPNPSSGEFTISLQDYQNGYSVEIYNVLGEKIYQSILNNSQNTINLNSQPAGMYFIYLKSDEGIEVGKILVTNK